MAAFFWLGLGIGRGERKDEAIQNNIFTRKRLSQNRLLDSEFSLMPPICAATLRSCDFYNPQAMSLCIRCKNRVMFNGIDKSQY